MRKVLVVGIGKPNFILPLYAELKKKLQDFQFESLNLRDYKGIVKTTADEIFFKNHFWKITEVSFKKVVPVFFTIFFTSWFWKDNFISFVELGPKYFRNIPFLVKTHVNAYLFAKVVEQTNPNFIHLHFPNHRNALFFRYLKKRYHLIITFWGSDIYRIKTLKSNYLQADLLRAAHKITVTTPEMKFALLTRYGFNLNEKIVQAKFIMNNKYIDETVKLLLNNNWRQKFFSKYSIHAENIKIMFGNNAFKSNNHIKFLEQLNKLPARSLNKFHIIFPLTYGDEKGSYINEIKKMGSQIPVPITYITEFLDWENLTKLKLITDVYIHGPVTDGLSAFLIEYLYTNQLAIVGGWLPYKTFRDMELKYLEFKDYNELPYLLQNVPNLILKSENKSNSIKIQEFFSKDILVKEWAVAYKT